MKKKNKLETLFFSGGCAFFPPSINCEMVAYYGSAQAWFFRFSGKRISPDSGLLFKKMHFENAAKTQGTA
ncbi:hypothetical protein K7I13_12975 [Brucepastera parasyntrophica]|uniref:hypothetical protein n=1 Tax=Brucepastera parasyntrophica TaxID=2880008 RepID=UPI00210B3D1E|nr:hypothetical protein [Brucepastera parasyntrophica]ULQ59378.1 hypothetical protein K7I13_12975 [Brucepastera parasyntrophica]